MNSLTAVLFGLGCLCRLYCRLCIQIYTFRNEKSSRSSIKKSSLSCLSKGGRASFLSGEPFYILLRMPDGSRSCSERPWGSNSASSGAPFVKIRIQFNNLTLNLVCVKKAYRLCRFRPPLASRSRALNQAHSFWWNSRLGGRLARASLTVAGLASWSVRL